MEEVVKKIEKKNNWLLWLLIGACSLIASGYYNYSKIKARQEYLISVIQSLDCVDESKKVK
jgi:hypothetical protein